MYKLFACSLFVNKKFSVTITSSEMSEMSERRKVFRVKMWPNVNKTPGRNSVNLRLIGVRHFAIQSDTV